MTLGVAGLLVGYSFILVLLLIAVIYTTLHWTIRAGFIVASLAFFLITYHSFSPLLGWPAAGKLPEKMLFVSAFVKQPNKITGDEGNIFIWAVDIGDDLAQQVPRAYRLPYSDPLHREVIEAERKSKNGTPQMGEVVAELENSDLRRSQASNEGGGDAVAPISFYDMPVAGPPEK